MYKYDEPSSYEGRTTDIILTGHFQVNDNYKVARPEGRNDWLIAYTLSGEGYFSTDEETIKCSSGEIILIKPGTPHNYWTGKGKTWTFMWAHFSAIAIGDKLLPTEHIFKQSVESASLHKRIYRAFRKIISDSRERNEYWHDLCLNSLREIVILMAQKQNQRLDPRVEEVLHYLSVYMQHQIYIDDLSKAIGISASRIAHLVKEQTGLSIIDHLNQMRIRQAALLLRHTNRNASEVSYEVGFHNYNHFIRQFKKWHGTTPSEFKQSLL